MRYSRVSATTTIEYSTYGILQRDSSEYTIVGMGEDPKHALELVDYRLGSRPLTDPRSLSLALDLDSIQNRTQLNHFK